MFHQGVMILLGLFLSASFVVAADPTGAASRPWTSPMPYHESLRPRFHFTSRTNWLNDPNGLVRDGDEFHLFFQHNPIGNEWGNMTWGHAVSPDLVHWKQLDDALKPDALGTIFSGSAVVDKDDTAGFQTGRHPALVAIYTAAGGTSDESKGKPFTQCLAYSNDHGRTWTKYAGNPVLANIAPGNRDPKVVWYAPSRCWIMALYKEHNDFALFASRDLKTWKHLQDLTIDGSEECPDFFELPLDGNPEKPRWIFSAADGRYIVGKFDGRHFTAECGPFPSDYGGNYYAVQSFSNMPLGQRVQMAWMRGGKYPGMPFNQQMSFPCNVQLRSTPDGPRLYRTPIKEIESLYLPALRIPAAPVGPGHPDPMAQLHGECFDVRLNLVPPSAANGRTSICVYGYPLTYHVDKHALSFLDRSMPVRPGFNKNTSVRLLVDRTSLEVFAEDGLKVMSCCFVPKPGAPPLALRAEGGPAGVSQIDIHPLKSAWE